jgi:hypothetical protein
MKVYGGADVQINVVLILALVGGGWSASCPVLFNPREIAPGTHLIGGCVGPRTSLDDMENRKILPLPGFEFGPLGHPAHSQSLYRARYSSSSLIPVIAKI